LFVYDFDHTIYDGDSSVDFHKYCMRKSPVILLRIPGFCMALLRYKLNRISKEKMKGKWFSFLCKIDVDTYVDSFWESHRKKLKQWYLEKDHSNDVIISASPEFLLRGICDELGVRKLIATDMNRNTGKIAGLNCHGKEKVMRFFGAFPGEIIDEFYTDSMSDLPMLRQAKKGFVVKRDHLTAFEE